MSLKSKDIQKKYPLPVYNFRVSLLNLPMPIGASSPRVPGAQSVSFSEVSGLEQQYEPVIYRDGFSFVTGATLMSGRGKEINLTLRRGVVKKKDELYKWLNVTRLPLVGKKDLLIDLCDEKGLPKVRWVIRGAMPTKITAPDFKADSNEVAYESVELMAVSMSIEYFD